jgi:hypothetical protein
MATQTMPDGWQMLTGKWDAGDGAGGDARLVSVATGNGGLALQIGGTAVLTKMAGPWRPLDNSTLAGNLLNASYQLDAATSLPTLGVTGTVAFVVYAADRTTVVSTTTLLTTPGGQVYNSALLQTPGGPWGRFEITKTSASLGVFHVYTTSCKRNAPYFHFPMLTTLSVANTAITTFATVQFDDTANRFVGECIDGSSGISVSILKSGLWQVNFSAYFDSMPGAANYNVAARLVDGSLNVISPTYVIPGNSGTGAAATPISLMLSHIVRVTTTPFLISAQVSQSSAAPRNLFGRTAFGGQTSPTFMSGVLIR